MTNEQPVFTIDINYDTQLTLYEPAIVYETTLGIVYRIDEYDQAHEYYKALCTQFIKTGRTTIANNLVALRLPKDQAEIDKVLRIHDYMKQLYERSIKKP